MVRPRKQRNSAESTRKNRGEVALSKIYFHARLLTFVKEICKIAFPPESSGRKTTVSAK